MDKEELKTCSNCGTEWKKVDEESGKFHKVYEPDCNCYDKELRLNIG
jgi:hypothetical protein